MADRHVPRVGHAQPGHALLRHLEPDSIAGRTALGEPVIPLVGIGEDEELDHTCTMAHAVAGYRAPPVGPIRIADVLCAPRVVW